MHHHMRGTDFLCPPYHVRKALYLLASAFFLVDALGHITPIFALGCKVGWIEGPNMKTFREFRIQAMCR